MLDMLHAVVSKVDTGTALARLKVQGQAFSRAYYEFAMLKDLSLTHPIVWSEWQRLNALAVSMRGIVGTINAGLDSVNGFAGAIFGNDLLPDITSDFLNAYILSSIAALKFATDSLTRFNRSIHLPVMKTGTAQ